MFFSANKKSVYISFAVAALAALVRSEGLFLFFAIFILFVIRHRKEGKIILRSLFSIGIYVTTLLPMAIVRIQINGNDTLTGRIINEGKKAVSSASNDNESNLVSYFISGLENPIKFLAWSQIPIFIFFIPFSVILILKERERGGLQLLLVTAIMLVPAFYALTQTSDTRYFLPLYPLFSIISIYVVKKLLSNARNKNMFLFLIIGSVLFSSCVFLVLKNADFVHEREAFEIAKHITNEKSIKGINDYYPESQYMRPSTFVDKSPVLSSSLSFGPTVFEINYQSLKEFIENSRKNGLDHLVVDGDPDKQNFFNDIYLNDQNYPYLKKIYDSSDFGYKYHVKIYKIDYEMFDLIK